MEYSDIPPYVSEYLAYLSAVKARSELTIRNYYYDIKLFLKFLKVKRLALKVDATLESVTAADVGEDMIKSVTLLDIMEFLHFAAKERENDTKARARKAVSIRQFFKYLTNNKLWFISSPAQNLETPKIKKALPKHLTVEQATDLLKTCAELHEWQDYRDYCMVTFFLNCGMRLSELTGINYGDIRQTKDGGDTIWFLKVLGKGNKERIIYLNGACVSAYTGYLAVRPDSGDKALFLSRLEKRISNRRVEQIIDEKLKLCGLNDMGFSVHKLRHTAATLMYQNGVDVRVLKEVLGHENLDTTQIYTHVADKQIMQAVMKNPLADKSMIKGKK